MEKLPLEMIYEIAQYLSLQDLLSLSSVSSFFYHIILGFFFFQYFGFLFYRFYYLLFSFFLSSNVLIWTLSFPFFFFASFSKFFFNFNFENRRRISSSKRNWNSIWSFCCHLGRLFCWFFFLFLVSLNLLINFLLFYSILLSSFLFSLFKFLFLS